MRPALFLAVALALGALPVAAPAAPDTSVVATDVRCLLVSGALAQSDDAELKNIGTLSLFYFWGRLEGRGAPSDIVQRLIDESKKLTPDDVKAMARPTLRHRVMLRPEAELEGATTDGVLDGILASVPVPR